MHRFIRSVLWWFRHFSWYLTLLTACVAISTAVASVNIKRIANSTDAILSTLEVQEAAKSDLMNGVDWTLTISWVLLGSLVAGSAYNVVSKFIISRARDQFRRGTLRPGGCCGWSLVYTSRIVLNVLHTVAIVTGLWLVLLLCAQCLAFVALSVAEEVAKQAGTLAPGASQGAHAFAAETTQWLQQYGDQLTNVTDNLQGYCGRVQCDLTVPEATVILDAMEADIIGIQAQLAQEKIDLCPSTACINLSLLWFLGESGCVCDAEAIARVVEEAAIGIRNCRSSAFCLIAATLCMLLLLSKVAMNLKSLIKDDHWMRRIRILVERVAHTKGVPTDDSIYDPIYADASMSNFGFGRGIPAHLASNPNTPRAAWSMQTPRTPRHPPPFAQVPEEGGAEEAVRDTSSGVLAVEVMAPAARAAPSAPLPPQSPGRHVFTEAV